MRYIITIRKPEQPTVYYLSKNGFRCYETKNIHVYRSLADVLSDREHFAKMMPEYRLTVERLPANVRTVKKAVLSASPIDHLQSTAN